MSTFLARLSKRKIAEEVLYLQSQNDNLHGELDCLLDDATEDIDFASQVFKCKPDATNVWIGDERSVTSLHKDPYENLYLVVHGTKTFDLLPPTEYFCLHGERAELVLDLLYGLSISQSGRIERDDTYVMTRLGHGQ